MYDSLRVSLDLMSLMFLPMGQLDVCTLETYCEPIIPGPSRRRGNYGSQCPISRSLRCLEYVTMSSTHGTHGRRMVTMGTYSNII